MGWDGMGEAALADERGGIGWEEMGLAKLLTNGVAWYGVGGIGREGLGRVGTRWDSALPYRGPLATCRGRRRPR